MRTSDSTPPKRRLALPQWLLALLNDERARFVVVGGFNTLFGYATFATIEIVFGARVHYLVSLLLAHLISTLVAFTTHRKVTYRIAGRGNILWEFLRFQGLYVGFLLFNSVALTLWVETAGLNSLVAQIPIVVFGTIASYVGNKYFTFRKKARGAHS